MHGNGNLQRAAFPFVIPITFSSVNNGNSSSDRNAAVTPDRVFVWTHIQVFSDGGEEFTITLEDTTMGEAFFNAEAPMTAFGGSNNNPFELAVPWRFEPKTIISATVSNIGSSQDTCRINLLGFKE